MARFTVSGLPTSITNLNPGERFHFHGLGHHENAVVYVYLGRLLYDREDRTGDGPWTFDLHNMPVVPLDRPVPSLSGRVWVSDLVAGERFVDATDTTDTPYKALGNGDYCRADGRCGVRNTRDADFVVYRRPAA